MEISVSLARVELIAGWLFQPESFYIMCDGPDLEYFNDEFHIPYNLRKIPPSRIGKGSGEIDRLSDQGHR